MRTVCMVRYSDWWVIHDFTFYFAEVDLRFEKYMDFSLYRRTTEKESESAMKKGKKKTKHRQWNDREMLAEIIGVVIDVINMEIF